ncbi:MAG: phosphatidate cytidylyltransferase [Candidatus Eisenbacteria bacterium]|uniref:Phosphatidate cytidylyltransferase n=1 Tax=Eiseniibacteriota bacterium TaxID=2212470 RepID=A0A9D6L5R1_UNCEI|nr:phosphatidate cytidylyltransferase [Candidatus Eisenbacteria bacterium]MBI3539291.1 phosphatidate cytidylyltransferase [Candidatus Eisenbacteria bacterium]
MTPAAARPSAWALRLRVASAVLFLPVLVLLARAGGFAFWAFVAVQVTLGLIEFYRMMRGIGLRPSRRLGIVAALGLLWVCWRPDTPHVGFLATFALLLVLALELRRPEAHRRVEDIAVTSFGVLYVGWLSAHLVLLRELPWRAGTAYAQGAAFVLLAFFLAWSCDSAAYLVGRLIGRTRPWARISPGKSLEGNVAGLAAAVAAAFIARRWFAPFLGVADAAALGVLVGLFAQVGDLVESLLKRDTAHGVSSDLIPGHGGVLDRFDSLYFAAPVVYYYLAIVVFRVP